MKVVLGVAVALLVALGVGWVWGAAGKAAIDRDRMKLEQRADYESGRAAVFEGRVALFQSNFGDASAHFERARIALEKLQLELREVGEAERAGRIEIALSNLKDAVRRANQLDVSAQNAAVAALQALNALGYSQ